MLVAWQFCHPAHEGKQYNMFIKTHDADIFATSFGGGPRTLVAHGGWVGSGELWSFAFEDLSRLWRCVSYDHRGTGATISGAPHITFNLLVQDVFHVLDSLGIEQCVLAAESAGAMIALAAALERPERFDALVLIGARYQGNRGPGAERLLQGCRSDFRLTMDAFIDACVPEDDCAAERAWGKKIVMRSRAQDAIELMECLQGAHLDNQVSKLQLPTLLLHGTRDLIAPPANSERLASLIPDSTLVMIEDAGHVPMVTRPRQVTRAIEEFVSHLATPRQIASSRTSQEHPHS